MYAATIVEQRLRVAREELGFELEYHSPNDIANFNKQLESKYPDAYSGARAASTGMEEPVKPFRVHLLRALCNAEAPRLSKDEVRFIQNEQALIMCDAAYFLTRYYWVFNEHSIRTLYKFRAGQRVLFDVIAEMEMRGIAIEIILAKARQLGMTTVVAGLELLKVMFSAGVSGIIASADTGKTREMASKIFFAYDALPWWLPPLTTKRVESESGLISFIGESRIVFQHGKQTNPIAMGSTPITYHLCLSGKTLVRLQDSTLKPIREIKSGDTTVSSGGALTRIKAVWKSPRASELTSEIGVWGTPSLISCTRDHPVLTEDGWKDAAQIRSGDSIIYPVRPITNEGDILMGVFDKHQRRVVGEKNSRLDICRVVPTFALGRLVGLYLAEGSIQKNSAGAPSAVYYTIHQKEVDTVEGWCREVFGPELRQTLKRINSKTAQVVLNRRGFGVWLVDNFGQKDTKRIPDICWGLGEDFCRGLVYGYIFGDGHYSTRDNTVYATSIRVALPVGIRELLASLGYGWSQIVYREAGEYYNRNCQAAWIITIAGETARKLRADFGYTVHPQLREARSVHWKWHARGLALEIDRVGDGFSEDFYDLEVEDSSHQFLTICGLVHNSEVSSYPNPENLVEVGLFKCVHPNPRVLGILESTCKGDVGWWYDTYWNSKRKWKAGGSRLMALFLPFYCDSDMYPNETWLLKSPVPRNWIPDKETRKMIAESELYVQTNPILNKVLKAKQGTTGTWRMPVEQSWYWEQNFLEHRSKGAERTWYQEMPHTDDAAFQGSYDNVFGREVVAEAFSDRPTSYSVYAIIGQSIEDRHDPDEDQIDYAEPIIPVTYRNMHDKTYRWELLPLKWREPFRDLKDVGEDDSHMGKFFVWLPPEPGYDYAIGADTSNGIGRDSTVFAVARLGRSPQEQDVQAAEFRSNQVSHVEAYAWVMAIAAYYARFMEGSTNYKEPYVSIEQIASVGDTCQFQMGKMGYKRFHRMTRMDSTPKRMRKANSNRIGWYTSGWSRPALTDGFVVLVKNNWYKVNSPYTMREMTQWEVHYTSGGKEKYEHSEAFTDDGIFANAMAAFCPKDQTTMADRSKKQFNSTGKGPLPELDLRTSSGIIVPTSISEIEKWHS